jgi:FHS family L-fucose permease-like MFS transporter
MALGCVLFTPAAHAGVYEGFLAALFILASGVTIVQVAANPLAATAGDPTKAHSRLTLAQAFNSLATTVGPLFGSAFILSQGLATPDAARLAPGALIAARQAEAHAVRLPFLIIAASLIVIATVCWLLRRLAPPAAEAGAPQGYANLLRRPRLMLGALTIFLYVGAEVSIGSALANYLMSAHTLSAQPGAAGSMVSIYWGLAMVGRFVGSAVLRKLPPSAVLTTCAAGAVLMAVSSAFTTGAVSAGTILAVGLCNSVMFPTIFTLAIEGLGERAAKASGLLCLAIVGGAIVPMLTGVVADHAGLSWGLLVPASCYVWIALYGWLSLTGRLDRPMAASLRGGRRSGFSNDELARKG